MVCPNCQHSNKETARFCENCGTPLASVCPNCGQPVTPNQKFCANCGYNLTQVGSQPEAASKQSLGGSLPSPVTRDQSPVSGRQSSIFDLQSPASEDPTLTRLKRLVPKEFAERLLKSQQGKIERERRIVTILFCDVKGSTALGEERDPEDIMEVMNGAFDILIEPVYRYEGTLARLMGDAILAFFGAPIAHEDDPERAVLAALAIQERMVGYANELKRTRGIENFSVRVGINTGLVVVGEVGSDLRVEYTAMGDAINLASRLENAAHPGTIVISENTARLVRHSLELESLGSLTLKGKAEPVPAYRVLGRKATPESARGLVGLDSPLVGRVRERAALENALDQLQAGDGSVVSLIGEAGLGKSRLLAEVQKSRIANRVSQFDKAESATISDLPYAIRWLEGRSLSYETNTPYAPFVDLLSRLFEFQPQDTDIERYERIHSRMNEWMPGRADETAPFIAMLMGIELLGEALERVRYMEPPMLHGAIVMNALALFGTLAAKQPTVLVFEDVHWADISSLELIKTLLPLPRHAPLTIILLMRPNKNDPAWQLHEMALAQLGSTYTPLELQPLDEREARTLVANLLHIEDLPESVRALILKKSEGNPFFVEEVIRSLLDQKLVVRSDGHWRAEKEITKIDIPDTLTGVITARLDRLDEDARRTAQTAAVVGREFEYDILAEISDTPDVVAPSLAILQQRELVRSKSAQTFHSYLFKHALTQETAENTLLKSKRTLLHKRVAETLEHVAPGAINDIARHFKEGGELARALPYYIAAGGRALQSFAVPEAVEAFTQAVEVAKAGDNTALARRAFEGLANALAFSSRLDDALKLYQQMFDWGQAHNDGAMAVSALNKTAWLLGMRKGEFAGAEAKIKEAEELAKQVRDKAGLSEAYTMRCMVCMSQADFDGTVYYMQESVNIGRELQSQEQTVFGLTHIASAQMSMADFTASYRTGQEAMPLALEIGDRLHEADLLVDSFGYYYLTQGEIDRAIESLSQGVEMAVKINGVITIVGGGYALGLLALERGEFERARREFERARQYAEPLREHMTMMYICALAPLGGVDIEISPMLAERGHAAREETLALLDTPTGPPGGGSAYPDLGFAELRVGNLEHARELFTKGLQVPSLMRVLMRPRSLCGMALVESARGNRAEAEKYVREARELVEGRPMKNLFPQVALTEAHIAATFGDYSRALQDYARAEFYASQMNFRSSLWRAQAGAARMLVRLGRTQEAATKRSEALATIDDIASMLSADSERALFISSARGEADQDLGQ